MTGNILLNEGLISSLLCLRGFDGREKTEWGTFLFF